MYLKVLTDFSAMDLDEAKVKILIDECKLQMNISNLRRLRQCYPDCVLHFIEKNLREYCEIMSQKYIEIDEVEEILTWDILKIEDAKQLIDILPTTLKVIDHDYSDDIIAYILGECFSEDEFIPLLEKFFLYSAKVQNAIIELSDSRMNKVVESMENIDFNILKKILTSDNIQHTNKVKLPDSLNEYGKNILNLIPVEKKATRNFINEQIKNLIDTGKLKPCNYMGDNKEGQNNLKCNGFREICRKYWEGEVISAFCFIPLKEVKPEEVSYFCIKVQTNGDVKIVKVVFICTELTMSQSIQKLMDFSFFNTSDQKEDGILFLWNNQNDDAYYHGILSKSDSMNIVRKITEDYLTFDIEDVQERMDMFHIVEGDKLRCNIAAIGVGQIRDTVLYSGNGNKQFMKNMLDSLIENAWS